MQSLPEKVLLTKGTGQSFSSLNSFDNALLDAGIANYNHIKLSSILAPNISKATFADLPPEGSLLPGVIAECRGKEGEILIACLSLAYNKDKSLPGMIFELTAKGNNSFEDIKFLVETMALEGMSKRNWGIDHIETYGSVLEVTERFGTALVVAVML